MLTRTLGNGFEVSPISYGAMGLSEFYGQAAPEAGSLALLEKAFDLGVRMIDTADMYGRGHNEELIGRFLTRDRGRLAEGLKIATKFGLERAPDDPYKRRINNSPAYIRQACESSLRRLGLERIDLYYAHRLAPEADLSATMGTLNDLIREGKVAHIGLCEVSAATLKAAHQLCPVTVLQSEYSLWTREVEEKLLPLCRELNIGFVAYSPLGRGFLSGKYTSTDNLEATDFRRSNPRFQPGNLARNLALLPALQKVAEELGASPAQAALAWLLGRYEHLAAIPGTRHPQRLAENMAAAGLKLSPEQSRSLENTFQPEAVAGLRYTPEGMKGLNA